MSTPQIVMMMTTTTTTTTPPCLRLFGWFLLSYIALFSSKSWAWSSLTQHHHRNYRQSTATIGISSSSSTTFQRWLPFQRMNDLSLASSSINQESTSSSSSSSISSETVSSINLDGLLEDHEEEAKRLAKSVTAWLDAEWMPQAVHVSMAMCAANSYVKCRLAGEHDLLSILMTLAEDLEQTWDSYEPDAFGNAWDIANYVADYLTQRAGLERCSCSHQIY